MALFAPDLPFEDCIWNPEPLAWWDAHGKIPYAGGETITLFQQRVEKIHVFGAEREFAGGRNLNTLLKLSRTGIFEDGKGNRWALVRSDDPQELCSAWVLSKRAHGRVLCVGAGMGVAQQMLAANDNVTFVKTIDVDEEVLGVVRTVLPNQGAEVVKSGEPWDYMRATEDRFDTVYLHVSPSYDFEKIPLLNRMASEARKVLVPGVASKVYAWGYQRMLELYEDHWVRMGKRVTDNKALVRSLAQWRDLMATAMPMAGETIRWLRQADFETGGADIPSEVLKSSARRFALGCIVYDSSIAKVESRNASGPTGGAAGRLPNADSLPEEPTPGATTDAGGPRVRKENRVQDAGGRPPRG